MGNYGLIESSFVVSVVFLIIGWVVCLLRAWVKVVIIKKVTVDDYLMLAGLFFYTAYAGCSINGSVHSITAGADMDEILKVASIGMKTWWLCEMLYSPVSLCVRTSIALFLRQIAVSKIHRRIIVATIAVFWISTIPLFFIVIFQCKPISYFWTQPFPDVPRGTCLDTHVLYYVSIVHSVISASCDLVLGILPVFMLWKVRLNKRTKVSLSMLLGMGIFAGIALVVRITYVRPFGLDPSFLDRAVTLANWSIVEPSLSIIAGCLATLRPLFSCFGRTAASRGSSRTPGQYGHTQSSAKSRTIKSIKGVGFIFKPAYLYSRKGDAAATTQRSTGLLRYMRTADESVPDNGFELMVNGEKDPSPFSDTAFARASSRLHDTPSPTNRSRTSLDSGKSVLLAENEESDNDATATLGQQARRRHSKSIDGVASAHAATQPEQADPADSSPQSPSRGQILVKKKMVVEYQVMPDCNSGQTGPRPAPSSAQLPSSTSTEDRAAGASKGRCSGHSVSISGPQSPGHE